MDEREEFIYATVAAELARGEISTGLMAKAVEQARGDRGRVESSYIKLRVKQVKSQLREDARAARELERQKSIDERDRRESLRAQGILTCDDCGWVGEPMLVRKGNILTALVLACFGGWLTIQAYRGHEWIRDWRYWVVAWGPGVLYAIFKDGHNHVCPQCRAKIE